MKMHTFCIIPARGGSKGIPRKNLCMIGGKPLIAWSIEAARAASHIDRVIVTTDDDEIAETAREWGAYIVRRPASLADDNATSESAILHALDRLEKENIKLPDYIAFLQPTSPYRLPEDIDGAIHRLETGGYDSVFSACPEHFTGRWRMDPEGRTTPLNFDPAHRPRRQDYPIEYLENGSIYIFKTAVFRESGTRMCGRTGIYDMPQERSLQLDGPEHLAFFDRMLSRVSGHDYRQRLPSTAPPSPSALTRLRLLVLDFDGVLTDNRVWVDADGSEQVCCSRADSWGLTQLKKAGLDVIVISTETNQVVEARCNKIGIPCISGCANKLDAISRHAERLGISREAVAFVGNDTNDQSVLDWVGLPILVADAHPALRFSGGWLLTRDGGKGAVRDVCDAILASRISHPAGEGFYFIRREPAQKADYEAKYWGTVRDPDGIDRDRRQEREKTLAAMKTELTFLNRLPGGRILDAGCGLGFLLSGLGDQWERHGVEISKLAAEYAHTWGTIVHGTLEEANYPSEHFDTVVLHHVIEHLDQPLQTLREIRRILRPGGWLILGTPDFDSGCARRFGKRYRLLHDPTHVSLFTCESMHRLLRDESFVIENVDYPYFETPYFTGENLLRMLDTDAVSPPFYGNFMTFYARKPETGECLRPPRVKLTYTV